MKYTKEQLLEIYEKECIQNKLRYSEVKKKYNIPRGTWDYWIRQKYNKTAEGAIAQIKQRKYTEKLKAISGEILLAGINYDEKTKKHECRIETVLK